MVAAIADEFHARQSSWQRCASSRLHGPATIGCESGASPGRETRGNSMAHQRRPLQPGEASPAFTLPAANREGTVSLADLRGRPFLIGFYRGLHCPFCRRQGVQLG